MKNKNLLEDRDLAELYRDQIKWKIRRRMAIFSFVILIFLTTYFVVSPFYMSKETSDIAREFNGIIMTLIGFFSGIVMVYIGAVTYSDTSKENTQIRNSINK